MIDEITTGDARELAKRIPDASVDLVFTDPVYWQIEDYAWLAQEAARVLKDDGNLLAYCGNVQQVEAGAAMLPYLRPRPTLSTYLLPSYARLFDCKVHVNQQPLLWFCKGKGRPQRWITLQNNAALRHKNHGHAWGKNFAAVWAWLCDFTQPGALVWEPFAGGGTIPAVCKMLGRHYIASEIDPATAERARERVFNTQPPLPGLVVEQLEVFSV